MAAPGRPPLRGPNPAFVRCQIPGPRRGHALLALSKGPLMPDAPFAFPGSRRAQPGHRFWLVFGLPWPAGTVEVAEAAYAVAAPYTGDESLLIAQIFAVGQLYAEGLPEGAVVWFSELTRWLDTNGFAWSTLGIDWQQALDELPDPGLPGVLLGIDRRSHLILCDASRNGLIIEHPGGRHERVTNQQRQRLYQRMRDLLERPDSPPRPTGGPGTAAR